MRFFKKQQAPDWETMQNFQRKYVELPPATPEPIEPPKRPELWPPGIHCMVLLKRGSVLRYRLEDVEDAYITADELIVYAKPRTNQHGRLVKTSVRFNRSEIVSWTIHEVETQENIDD